MRRRRRWQKMRRRLQRSIGKPARTSVDNDLITAALTDTKLVIVGRFVIVAHALNAITAG
jgi:hypothetical protein